MEIILCILAAIAVAALFPIIFNLRSIIKRNDIYYKTKTYEIEKKIAEIEAERQVTQELIEEEAEINHSFDDLYAILDGRVGIDDEQKV